MRGPARIRPAGAWPLHRAADRSCWGGEGPTMTEAEWLAATDPGPMLAFPRDGIGERKLRLFAVACCRRVWAVLADEDGRRAVEVAERYADGASTPREVRRARTAAARATAGLDAVAG